VHQAADISSIRSYDRLSPGRLAATGAVPP
jgi:hypothetical protein